MKSLLKRIGLGLSPRVDQLGYYLNFFQHKKLDHLIALNRQVQIVLTLRYQELARSGAPLPSFEEVEFRSFSQHGEDGILLYIFSLIGSTDKRVVEICAGDGVECNAANLIVNHSWTGLLFDGDASKIRFGRRFYTRHLNTLPAPPMLVHAWIDVENVNDLITSNGVQGEIDLLSLDLDGVDYWIWKAITCIHPRVVVLEYNAALGASHALTVPYRRDFRAHGDYWGASLPAFVRLGKQKGYRLVGCEQMGVNAFFIRSGVGDVFPEVSPEACFDYSRARQIHEQFLARAVRYDWVEI